jgi:hypothetical protein
MFVSKIQAAISHPSLLTACQMALAVTSGFEQKLVRSVSRSLTTECTRTDQETFRRLWPTSGCNVNGRRRRIIKRVAIRHVTLCVGAVLPPSHVPFIIYTASHSRAVMFISNCSHGLSTTEPVSGLGMSEGLIRPSEHWHSASRRTLPSHSWIMVSLFWSFAFFFYLIQYYRFVPYVERVKERKM